jgi:hypothetical protein
MSADLVRLRNSQGADEANIEGHSFPRQPDGTFIVPEDVALQLLGVPAGFFRATPDQPPTRKLSMDFLALTPSGDPHPHAQFHVGNARYESESDGIVRDVAPNHAVHLLNSGAVPLTPPSWVDPRVVVGK